MLLARTSRTAGYAQAGFASLSLDNGGFDGTPTACHPASTGGRLRGPCRQQGALDARGGRSWNWTENRHQEYGLRSVNAQKVHAAIPQGKVCNVLLSHFERKR